MRARTRMERLLGRVGGREPLSTTAGLWQWDYNPELYPSSGAEFVSKLGNLSMTYYTNGFNADSPYCNVSRYGFVKQNEPHPNTSRLFCESSDASCCLCLM
jgi:hypothetical protein